MRQVELIIARYVLRHYPVEVGFVFVDNSIARLVAGYLPVGDAHGAVGIRIECFFGVHLRLSLHIQAHHFFDAGLKGIVCRCGGFVVVVLNVRNQLVRRVVLYSLYCLSGGFCHQTGNGFLRGKFGVFIQIRRILFVAAVGIGYGFFNRVRHVFSF